MLTRRAAIEVAVVVHREIHFRGSDNRLPRLIATLLLPRFQPPRVGCTALDSTELLWAHPTVTVILDAKTRVVVPGGAPGDVYACEQFADGLILRRVYRPSSTPAKKMTKLKR